MEWQQFLGLGLVAAVVTALSNWASTWYFSKRIQEQSADFDSVRLAVTLERFSYECADLISAYAVSRAGEGNVSVALPEFPSPQFPADTAWKNLDLPLVDRLLRFQNDVLRANSEIEADYAQVLPDEGVTEPIAQAGLMGYRAHVLAQDLRAKYPAIGTVQRVHPWDFVSTLKLQHDMKMAEYETWPRNLD
jgi:hypothetical protein